MSTERRRVTAAKLAAYLGVTHRGVLYAMDLLGIEKVRRYSRRSMKGEGRLLPLTDAEALRVLKYVRRQQGRAKPTGPTDGKRRRSGQATGTDRPRR